VEPRDGWAIKSRDHSSGELHFPIDTDGFVQLPKHQWFVPP